MKKAKNILLQILVSTLPLAFLILLISDLVEVFSGQYDHTFGSEFHSPYSIYRNRWVYGIYHSIQVVALALLIWSGFRKKWVTYIVLLMVSILLIYYPMTIR